MDTTKFFLASNGDLYRNTVKLENPLREKFAWHYREIKTAKEFNATLRAGKFAWPGGYELFFITSDGACLCFDCAKQEHRQIVDAIHNKSDNGWRVMGASLDCETDSLIICDNCNKTIVEDAQE